MGRLYRPSQFAGNKGIIVETHLPSVSALGEGASVPADGTAGYEAGSLFIVRGAAVGAQLYVNEGSRTSCAFKPFASQTVKIARGQFTTVSASDTVVTGLTGPLVSALAVLESDPTDTCDVATCQIGDQAGAPAAGSIIIKTWKVTTGGAAGNPTLIAATAFTKKVNWIALS